MQLEHQIVIVTGGAAGIGGAISRVLAHRGAKVVAVDVDATAGTELETEFGADVAFIQADVGLQETDVAPIVAFLLSDDAKYMTGQTLMADGGANKLY